MKLMIVPGILVCSRFLISVCMFIMSKALLISGATVSVRAGGRGHLFESLLLRCCLVCVVLFILECCGLWEPDYTS